MGDESKIIKVGSEVAYQIAGKAIPGVSIARKLVSAVWGEPDAALTHAYQEQVNEIVFDLRQRVEDLASDLREVGQEPDSVDVISMIRLVEMVAETEQEGITPTKREALRRAFVAQFDPRAGTPPMRRMWMAEIRSLTGMQLEALGGVGYRFFIPHEASLTAVWNQPTVKIEASDVVLGALHHALGQASQRGLARYVSTDADRNVETEDAVLGVGGMWMLTRSGYALWEFLGGGHPPYIASAHRALDKKDGD
jgi:hypothetical protein